MTDREKLIELVKDGHRYYYSEQYKGLDSYQAIADHLIANGVTFATDNNVGDKWISVKDRLPKLESYVYSVDVLFYVPYENIYVGYVNFESGTWKCKDSRELFAADKVTHWMPLPEPPKGE